MLVMMRSPLPVLIACLVWGCWQSLCLAQADAARVELELFLEPGLSPAASHDWIQRLKHYEVDSLRFRAQEPGDALGLENVGTERNPVYQVLGRLNLAEQIELPGAVIPPERPSLLRDYLEALRVHGPEGVVTPRTAFGLTVSQFKQVHEDLAAPIDFSTKGLPAEEVVQKISVRLKNPIDTLEREAKELARPEALVQDELQGLASGTALAAAIRPAGLVFGVVKTKSGFAYPLRFPQKGIESWPIGWDSGKKTSRELAPQLFKVFDVELADVRLKTALDALLARIDLPMLFDWNNMAEADIDIETKKVRLKKGKLSYQTVLDRILGQAMLKMELRLDENDRPFLWVSTLKKIAPPQ